MSIQVLKPKFHVEECLEEIRECLENGWTGMGFKTVAFEEKWKEYTGHENAHFLNSATVGLHLAVKLLKEKYNWNDGDEIITTPITFVSTNHAILYENMKAVFADVDEYLCLDPSDVERKITEKTKAVIFVGYGGRVGQLDKVIEICKKKQIKVILDAAHMAGTKVNGVCPGTWDGIDVTVYSYQAVKNLPTSDSGMICFRDEELDKLCRKMTWLGIDKDTYARTGSQGSYKWKYEVNDLGYKAHGNSIIAAIGLVQLRYLDEDNIYRRKIAAIYDECFKDNDKIQIIGATHKEECSYHIYEIAIEDREGALQELAAKDIYGGVHYRDNTEYSLYSYAQGTCPYAHTISQKLLTLPLHLYLTEDDARMIAKIICDFVEGKR